MSNTITLLNAAFSSYADADRVDKPSGYLALSSGPFSFSNAETGLSYTTFFNAQTGGYILAFRGTDFSTIEDWATNFKLGWPQYSEDRARIQETIRTLTAQSGRPVEIVGHSLGGALAQFAAYDFWKDNPASKAEISLTTFNALGGKWGLEKYNDFDPGVVAGVNARHFYREEDVIAKFGKGHIGGNTVRLVDPEGVPANPLAAHQYEELKQSLVGTQSSWQFDKLPDYLAIPGELQSAAGNIVGALLDFKLGQPVEGLLSAWKVAIVTGGGGPLSVDYLNELVAKLSGLLSWEISAIDPQSFIDFIDRLPTNLPDLSKAFFNFLDGLNLDDPLDLAAAGEFLRARLVAKVADELSPRIVRALNIEDPLLSTVSRNLLEDVSRTLLGKDAALSKAIIDWEFSGITFEGQIRDVFEASKDSLTNTGAAILSDAISVKLIDLIGTDAFEGTAGQLLETSVRQISTEFSQNLTAYLRSGSTADVNWFSTSALTNFVNAGIGVLTSKISAEIRDEIIRIDTPMEQVGALVGSLVASFSGILPPWIAGPVGEVVGAFAFGRILDDLLGIEIRFGFLNKTTIVNTSTIYDPVRNQFVLQGVGTKNPNPQAEAAVYGVREHVAETLNGLIADIGGTIDQKTFPGYGVGYSSRDGNFLQIEASIDADRNGVAERANIRTADGSVAASWLIDQNIKNLVFLSGDLVKIRILEQWKAERGDNSNKNLDELMLRLGVADEFRTYLESSATVNTLAVLAGGDTPFSIGWASAVLKATSLGLGDPYSYVGTSGDDRVKSATGDDVLVGGEGNDTLYAYGGDDQLNGGGGADFLVGGSGDDVYAIDNDGDTIMEFQEGGKDTVYSSIDIAAVAENVEVAALVGSNALKALGNEDDNIILGNEFENELLGLAGNDTLSGGDSDDVLVGFSGNDLFYGGNGSDILDGGRGNDIAFGGAGSDVFIFSHNREEYLFRTKNDAVHGAHIVATHMLGGADGMDVLIDIEKVRFADGEYSLSSVLKPTRAWLSIRAEHADLREGDADSKAFSFTVTRSGDTSVAHSVSWSVTGGTATASDFVGGVLPSGTVVFAPGETRKQFLIDVAGDTLREAHETFWVGLTSPSAGAVVSASAAPGIIRNDDAWLSIRAEAADLREGDAGGKAFSFTVTRSGDTSVAHSVGWSITGGKARASDFVGGVLPSGNVIFAPGETRKQILIDVAGDTSREADETFWVGLTSPSAGAVVSASAARGIIRNDDTQPGTFSIASKFADAPDPDLGWARTFVYTITREGDTANAQSVSWGIVGGTADSADFIWNEGLPSGVVNFTSGQQSADIFFNVAGDNVFEPDETVIVGLSAPTAGARLGITTATGFIRNDDAQPETFFIPSSSSSSWNYSL